MKPNEPRKFDKMTLFLQDLTTELRLRQFSVKVSRNSSVKFALEGVSTNLSRTLNTVKSLQKVLVIFNDIGEVENLGKKNLDLHNIVDVTPLAKNQ